jgi:hypothetical protein
MLRHSLSPVLEPGLNICAGNTSAAIHGIELLCENFSVWPVGVVHFVHLLVTHTHTLIVSRLTPRRGGGGGEGERKREEEEEKAQREQARRRRM